ncbi:DNA methylase N-6 adenine-specific conserved site [Macrophomina phaseolina MS6]|uniref:DNA methylase N-6 adenine-specific conserved site n=1 Tax=Macrophomina phaseolina (strain MS6) TaxID=1126212 RepID=K2RTK0_MACPH|nr:DNA methylase N-6 adenine-specific conserved site [Macrophomina phaseolina MS6]
MASSAAVPSLMHMLRAKGQLHWDILISNPPYISPRAFVHTTTRSVRNFEPKLALVPPVSDTRPDSCGDVFYPKLLDIADCVLAKLVLFEVADMDQALRVARLAQDRGAWQGIEIWRDEPAAQESPAPSTAVHLDGIRILGRGDGRSVVCWRAEASQWLAHR